MNCEIKIMADFKPFAAWRYNLNKVSMEGVLAPPYDIINRQEQDELYLKSPHNCVRLILNREENSDTENNNRYSRARRFFHTWQDENILIQEEAPCFYLYRQSFKHPSGHERKIRWSLLGRLKLEPFEKGAVIPHEKTLAGPREDRRRLLEMTETNFSPIFGLYDDPQAEMERIYSGMLSEAPLFDVQDKEGVGHALWGIRGAGMIETIHEFLSDRKIYIADGHHRYQTALEYAARRRMAEGLSPDQDRPFDYTLMALSRFQDSGLVILPTHRIIAHWKNWDKERLLDALKKYFNIQSCPVNFLSRTLNSAPADALVFALMTEDRSYLLALQDLDAVRPFLPAAKPESWYRLDLNVLSYFVFPRLMELPESLWESVISYTRSGEEAVSLVTGGKAACAFLLRPLPVESLREMGEAGELMPQKSTYFYPKLASGLVFYQHKEGGCHGNQSA